jgi:ketosteroid isomerase-like protein
MTLKPEEVVLSVAQGWDQGPLTPTILDASLAWFADDAIVILIGLPPDQPDTFRGKAQIRAWWEALANHEFNLQLEVRDVAGDSVTTQTLTWMDWSRQAGVAPIRATEVYVVRDGKIVSETWTISPESHAQLAALSGT